MSNNQPIAGQVWRGRNDRLRRVVRIEGLGAGYHVHWEKADDKRGPSDGKSWSSTWLQWAVEPVASAID